MEALVLLHLLHIRISDQMALELVLEVDINEIIIK